jgi:hypothetical protein
MGGISGKPYTYNTTSLSHVKAGVGKLNELVVFGVAKIT